MATETVPAAPQPAPSAQSSGGPEKTGAANSTVSSFAQSLLRKEETQQKAQADAVEKAPEVTATPPEESATPATEEPQAPDPEAPTETKEEAEKPAEPEAPEKAEDALSHETKLDPKLQEKIDKRIARERLKTKAAEGQISQLQAQLAQLQQQVGQEPEEKITQVPVPSNMPLAEVSDMTALIEVQRQAKATQRAAEELLDRDDINDGVTVGDRKYSKADLKAIVRDARITLEDHVPARQQFLTVQQQAKQKTMEQFPYLRNRASTEYAEHQAVLKANPWLLSQPNADWIVAVQLKGMKALEAETAEAKKPAEKKPAPKPKPAGDQTVTSDASASRVPVGSLNNQAKAAASKVLEGKRGVTAKDFADFLRQNEQIKNSR